MVYSLLTKLLSLTKFNFQRTTMNTFMLSKQNALIVENLPLANKIAKSKKRKLSHVSYDELQAAAYIGLVEAARAYKPEKNDCFAAFAVWRIIGAVRDYLRELSWGTRANPQKMVSIAAYEDKLICEENSIDLDFFENLIKYLPTSNKTVMRLYYLEGKKIAEIADLLSLHQSRISQLLSDSRNRMYASLNDRQIELWAMIA